MPTLSDFISDEKLLYQLDSEYFKLTGEHICCVGKITEAYELVSQTKTIKTIKTMKKDNKYQFFPDTLIYFPDKGFHVSNETLTDLLAEELLKENPERIALFEKFPEPKPEPKGKGK